ncbi:MAG: hypothetical protein COA36_05000 [Desulfotalea sp.]|nr:MAG: hypothetical protein COA36_05000 [Desulfotalea sp.]
MLFCSDYETGLFNESHKHIKAILHTTSSQDHQAKRENYQSKIATTENSANRLSPHKSAKK